MKFKAILASLKLLQSSDIEIFMIHKKGSFHE